MRFFQLFLPLVYSASGIAKLRGDWLSEPYVLWTYVHDSYQTTVSWALANALPSFAWTLMQGATLLFEVGAPVWFAWRRTRPVAFYAGVTMHAFIGFMFGPVKWFALLMITLDVVVTELALRGTGVVTPEHVALDPRSLGLGAHWVDLPRSSSRRASEHRRS